MGDKRWYYIVNGITLYRLLSAPVLVFLIFTNNTELFKWLLVVSFGTDAIDGYFARKYKVVSLLGSKLDSVADDLTIVAAMIGVAVFFPSFIWSQYVLISIMLILYLLQLGLAFIKFKKLTTFHTYIAKCAAIFQGLFLILLFMEGRPIMPLFYAAVVFTIADLIEEIIMVLMIPKNHSDIRSLYWLLKKHPAPHKIG